MMNSLFQIDIPKRASHCFHNGERLLSGMEIYSLLLEEETKKFTRRDFCSACWSYIQKQEDQIESRVYWKTKIEYQKPSTESSRMSKAFILLKELQRSSEPQEAEIFVLCLFLSHARQLALRQEFQKEGFTYQVYEVLREEEYLTVKVIQLSHLQIEEIQKSIANKLQSS